MSGVYPRTGGGNPPLPFKPVNRTGLSPHGRGKPPQTLKTAVRRGSIPARAGETMPVSSTSRNPGVYPRTGGGNALPCARASIALGLSPHGRGKPAKGV